MSELISFSPTSPVVPGSLVTLVNALEVRRSAIRATFTADGGINRRDVAQEIDPLLRAEGFRAGSDATLSPRELDYMADSQLAALSIQAGRAATNNGGLLATLAAASCEDVDWLVLLVPERYKNSATGDAVEKQLRDLAVAHGVRLDLQAVVLVRY